MQSNALASSHDFAMRPLGVSPEEYIPLCEFRAETTVNIFGDINIDARLAFIDLGRKMTERTEDTHESTSPAKASETTELVTTQLESAFIYVFEKAPSTVICVFGGITLLIAVLLTYLSSSRFRGMLSSISEFKLGIFGAKFRDPQLASHESKIEIDDAGNIKPPSNAASHSLKDRIEERAEDSDQWKLFAELFELPRVPGSLDEMRRLHEQISARKSSGSDSAFMTAYYYRFRYIAGDETALDSLKELADNNSESIWPNALLGRHYDDLQRYDLSLRYYERIRQSGKSSDKVDGVIGVAECKKHFESENAAVDFINDQLATFSDAKDRSRLLLALSEFYSDNSSMPWLKARYLEEALNLNPDNLDARFSLAYFLGAQPNGELVAAYHYALIIKQRPAHKAAKNNLSIIFKSAGANGEQVRLLSSSHKAGEDAHASANLATVFTHAGLFEQAHDCLSNVTKESQQEEIVQWASKNLAKAEKRNADLVDSLSKAATAQHKQILEAISLIPSDPLQIQNAFIGNWNLSAEEILHLSNVAPDSVEGKIVLSDTNHDRAEYDLTGTFNGLSLHVSAKLRDSSIQHTQHFRNSASGLLGLSLFGSAPPKEVNLILYLRDRNNLFGQRWERGEYAPEKEQILNLINSNFIEVRRISRLESVILPAEPTENLVSSP